MKKTLLILIAGILMMAGNLYAVDGNLIVEGDATIDGNVGIGTSTLGNRLTIQGALNEGIAILNQSGDVVTLFDVNTAEEGRLKLFNHEGTLLMNFVAGGAAFFKATTVTFMDNSGNSMFKVDADGGYAQLALTSGSPPATDCDESSERGRIKVDNAAGLLYVCVDSGWAAK